MPRTHEKFVKIAPTTSAFDVFGRMRISNPLTLFDSKLVWDKRPLFWDEATVSGAGITSTHLPNEAAVEIASTANTAGHFVRQTFMRFNYQPGKAQRIKLTGVLGQSGSGEGVTSRLGYYDSENGIFFQYKDGKFGVGIRSFVTGAASDTIVESDQFNGENYEELGGVRYSDLNLDLTKSQIFAISIEWLGVGSVFLSVFIDGVERLLHIFHNANRNNAVYMSTPNLPARYELITTDTAPAASVKCICTTIISEGGQEENGNLLYVSTEGVNLDANDADEIYAVLGIRLKVGFEGAVVKLIQQSILAETNDDFEWFFLFNPTVAGTFTYSDVPNSPVQVAKGATANTITGGDLVQGGFVEGNTGSQIPLDNARRLGTAIDGTRDELILCVRPLSGGLDIQASLTLRDLS